MATKKEVDDAQSSVDNIDKEAKEQIKKAQGGVLKTQKDAEENVMGHKWDHTVKKASLKAEGGYAKVQVGFSDAIVYGIKGEHIAPYSLSFILGAECKTVVGLSRTAIDGAKSDDIGGAKVDILLGAKYERDKNDNKKYGGSPALKNEAIASDKMNSWRQRFGTWTAKHAQELFKVDKVKSEIKSLKEEIGKLQKAIDACQEAGTSYQAKIKSFKETCTSKAELEADTAEYVADGWQTYGSGSLLNLFPKNLCSMRGRSGYVICGPSKVTLTGPKIFLGKSF
jgi:hypothetical protein